MSNLAQEIRQKAQARWPGATVIARGRNWIRHQHQSQPDQFMLDAVIGPLHIQGTETEISTAWQPATGAWQYQMILADYNAYARNVLNAGDTIQYVDPGSGQSVTFQPLSLNWTNEVNSRQQIATPQAVTATVSDDTLIWSNGYGAGRHFRYQTQSARLQKLLTIDAAANLPTPTVTGTIYLELEFIIKTSSNVDLWLDGARWGRTTTRVKTANRIEFRSLTTGSALWHLDFPRAWDAAGNNTTGQFELRRQGGSYYITVRIPRTWIQAATFPIYMDPTIDASVGTGGDDCGIDGSGSWFSSDFNGWWVGYGPGLPSASMSFRWTGISGLSGVTIDAAYFSPRFSPNGTATKTNIYLERAASPAAPTTYSDFSGRTRTTAFAAWDDVSGSEAVRNSPSLTSLFQELVDNFDPSTIQLFWQNDGSAENNYHSVRTYEGSSTWAACLHIEYTDAAPPASTTISVADTGAGADALGALSVALRTAETGSGTDNPPGVAARLTIGDSGSGNDLAPGIGARLTQLETGSGSDALAGILARLALNESGSALDGLAGILARLAVADSSAGVDGLESIHAQAQVSETGSGAENQAVAARITISDTGSAADAITLMTFLVKTITEAGVGVDGLGARVSLSISDAGTFLDGPRITASLTIAELGSGTEALSLVTAVFKSVQEAATGTDLVGAIRVQVAVADLASGMDLIAQIAAALRVAELGAGVDVSLAFDASTQLVGITFNLSRRTMDFSLSARTITFVLSIND